MTKGGLTEPRRDMAWVLEAVLKALGRLRGEELARPEEPAREAPCDSLRKVVRPIGSGSATISPRKLVAMLSKLLFACLLGACAAFVPTTKLPGSRVARAAVSAPPQMGIGGVNGALDFGNLASGVGGEGTGIALGANEPALLAILLAIPFIIGTLFNGWQGYQDDDDDFFDTAPRRRPQPRREPRSLRRHPRNFCAPRRRRRRPGVPAPGRRAAALVARRRRGSPGLELPSSPRGACPARARPERHADRRSAPRPAGTSRAARTASSATATA